jgi:hypothetical protein
MSRKKNANKNLSKSTRFDYRSTQVLSKTIKKLKEKLKRSDKIKLMLVYNPTQI